MIITFDRKADACYIKFSKKEIERTKPVSDYCQVDLDLEGAVIGIELLHISQFMDDFKIWLNLNNAAEYLNKSPVTIRRWVKDKKIPYYKPGKEYLFTKKDLDDFTDKHKQI